MLVKIRGGEMMITTDSADDSIIERYQKESKELKEKIEELNIKISKLEKELGSRTNLVFEYEEEIRQLKGKLLIYEHDPIVMREIETGYDILYWDTFIEDYKIFATFFFNNLEEDLEEFCKEFILELKGAYITE